MQKSIVSEQQEVFFIFLVGISTSLFIYAFLVGLFLVEPPPQQLIVEKALARADIFTLRALCWIALLTSFVPFLAWELKFGSAFSFFWPLHGVSRTEMTTWRIGIFLKVIFLSSIISLLASYLASPTTGRFMETFNYTDLPLLSELSYIDALLVPVCAAFPIIAIMLYTVVPSVSPSPSPPPPPSSS
jgi:hypothetical protein